MSGPQRRLFTFCPVDAITLGTVWNFLQALNILKTTTFHLMADLLKIVRSLSFVVGVLPVAAHSNFLAFDQQIKFRSQRLGWIFFFPELGTYPRSLLWSGVTGAKSTELLAVTVVLIWNGFQRLQNLRNILARSVSCFHAMDSKLRAYLAPGLCSVFATAYDAGCNFRVLRIQLRGHFHKALW